MLVRILLIVLLFGLPIFSKTNHAYADPILESGMYSGLVVNADTGEILYNHKANSFRYPASLTKMMTLYLLFDALEKGKLTTKSRIKISTEASHQPPSNLGIKPGSTITVMEAIQALIIKSANDVAYAVAENLGGSAVGFSHMMNNKAKRLGMKNTKFFNPHGLYHEAQLTTAHDMARLAMAIQRHLRKYFNLFSAKSFRFKGKVIRSHNHVLLKYKPATGLKTGFITASGFNVVTTAHKPEGNLIAVVMGGQTAKIRDDHMITLLQDSYEKLAKKSSKYKQGSQSNDRINSSRPADKRSGYINSKKHNAFAVLEQKQ